MIVSIILLTISIYFLMGMFIQERQDDQLQQELQELIQKKEDEPGENSSGDSFIEVDDSCSCESREEYPLYIPAEDVYRRYLACSNGNSGK